MNQAGQLWFEQAHLAALAPHARAHLRRGRRVLALLGAALLLPGLVSVTIVALAASPRDQPLALASVFVVCAVLPGAALLALGLSPLRRHPLVAALEHEPHRVRSVTHAYQQTLEGDYAKLAVVTLAGGKSYDFPVPPDPPARKESAPVPPTSPRKTPDRTGILIGPICFFPPVAIFAVVLVIDAFEIAGKTYQKSHYRKTRDQLLSEMTAALADMLGVPGSIVLAVLLVGAIGWWSFREIRRYRALVAADRAALGP